MPHAAPAADHQARLDPAAERIARVYAQAILEAADAAGCRGQVIDEVASAMRKLDDEAAGRRQATFTTAVPLGDDEQRRIVAEVEGAVGVKLAPVFTVKADLIGGLVVRIGDTVYDQSIASGLSRLGGNLHRRTIHEIQYRRDRLTSA